MIIILMGVSGCGKTAIGTRLSKTLNVPFYDGDDFHPEANIRKMKSGKPLNDEDRLPWLRKLADKLEWIDQQGNGAVLACSALKKSYRKILHKNPRTDVRFVYLKGNRDLIARRLSERDKHFMPAGLLDSQFNTLEEPERAITISIDNTPDEIVQEIVTQL